MAINPADWPIDPYTVDGVELAARLNAVIPSEFNSLNSGKANLAGGNTWQGTQNFGGLSGNRIQALWGGGVLVDRTFLQSSITNGATNVGIIPNGTSVLSNITCYGGSDPTNLGFVTMGIDASGQGYIQTGGNGTQSAAKPIFQIKQAATLAFQIDNAGASYIVCTAGGAYGVLYQMSVDGTKKRSSQVDASSNLLFLNNGGVAVFQSSNNGEAFIYNRVTIAYGSTASGSLQIDRTRDASNNITCKLTDTETGIACALAYLPGVAATWTPLTDNGLVLGWSLARWTAVYAVSGTIQTSDAREKSAVREFNDNEVACAEELVDKIGFYQWLRDIDKDGEAARWQVGMTAQLIDSVFTKYALNSQAYGIVLYEEFEAVTEELDPESGEVIREARPYIDRWSASYAQLNQFLIRGMRSKQKKIEARLDALEAASAPAAGA